LLDAETIRRFYLDDFEWDRTSESWKKLIPKLNFNRFDLNDETVEAYWQRLQPRFNIPLNVCEQWLYPLYYNQNSTNNYGWLNYDRVEFLETELSFDVISEINVINEYKFHVDEGAKCRAYDKLLCTEQDKEYWKNTNTWRIPPIILDVKSLSAEKIPEYAEINGSFQLVEGHSRLGYLFAAMNSGVLTKSTHIVYLMRYK
jgi:hypothetical protein